MYLLLPFLLPLAVFAQEGNLPTPPASVTPIPISTRATVIPHSAIPTGFFTSVTPQKPSPSNTASPSHHGALNKSSIIALSVILPIVAICLFVALTLYLIRRHNLKSAANRRKHASWLKINCWNPDNKQSDRPESVSDGHRTSSDHKV